MHPSLRCCSARAHNPLIKFLGKRSLPSTPDVPHPHPAAPAELKAHFSEFLAKMSASGSAKASLPASNNRSTNATAVYNEFWEAPSRFWQPRIRELSEAEVETIMSGGASSY